MTLSLAPAAMTRGSSRWLLLGSLALNLFFVGIGVAMAVRAPAPRWDPDVFVRMERVADTLPQADADLLRAAINAERPALAAAQTAYHRARDEIRETLRQEPFDPAALGEVMMRTRAARQAQDQILQKLFAGAAAKMSRAGRVALADWPPHRKSAGTER